MQMAHPANLIASSLMTSIFEYYQHRLQGLDVTGDGSFKTSLMSTHHMMGFWALEWAWLRL
jgi:hypothetical protein